MVQSEVTPTIVAGVCDPGVPTTTGLRETGYNACPIVARAEEPECYPKTSAFEPCPPRPFFLPLLVMERQVLAVPAFPENQKDGDDKARPRAF
jgi:hypothetical protein